MTAETADRVADFIMLRVVPITLLAAVLFPVAGGLGFPVVAEVLATFALLQMLVAVAGVLVVVVEA